LIANNLSIDESQLWESEYNHSEPNYSTMQQLITIAILLTLINLGSADYVCNVNWYPTPTNANYGNKGFLRVDTSTTSSCVTVNINYLLATGTTYCQSAASSGTSAVDSSFLYSDAWLQRFLDDLYQAKLWQKPITLSLNTANRCQINYINF